MIRANEHNDDEPLMGQKLVQEGIITPQQLEVVLKAQRTGRQKPLRELLVDFGFLTATQMEKSGLQRAPQQQEFQLKSVEISKDVISLIPSRFANHYKVIPVQVNDNALTIAMVDPNDVQTLDELQLVIRHKLKPVRTSEKDILEAIRKYYGLGAETIDKMMGGVQATPEIQTVEKIDELNAEASISNFLNQILLEAHEERASDIHIEPFEDALRIRYRIDGVLIDAKAPSNIKYFKDSINARIKILSNLNIAEKRRPQDGRFKVRIKDIEIDLRISFMPTQHGETVVMRILNTTTLFNLNDLGFSPSEQHIIDEMLCQPHGIIFLTGPTGSGKTTTLYAGLSTIKSDERKIITIEDPIEYQLPGITQIQVNPEINLTFANGLRSMLRQDPDIMMVGEVRDRETAEIAVQIALTGHLVFSTLHTNDAASGVVRLLDMGIPPYLVTSTVQCFIAQRLVRKVCSHCRKPVTVTAKMLSDIDPSVGIQAGDIIYDSVGCEACKFSGYRGREGIYEFLILNDEIRKLIIERSTCGEIKKCAIKGGMRTLNRNGWEKVKAGRTTPQEVLRVTQVGTV
ncbi:MAG: GspE/PulE family protein [Candidatus Omnitrophica bacterium]|nr:GspE/PulE family protein [Candidatus Omnitrophota bacterium]